QPFSGDGAITARVANQQDTDPWAKAGVMFRETLAANSRHAAMVVTPGNLASFQRRTVTGDVSYQDQFGIAEKTPYWVRLMRNGNNLTGYASSSGVDWIQIGPTATLTNLASTIYVGLAVTAHNAGTVGLVSFD